MDTSQDILQSDEADRDLAEAMASLVAGAPGRGVSVASFRREPSQFATLFAAERVTLVLHDGSTHTAFVKHLGLEQAEHPDKQRRDREVLVYAGLLAGSLELPVARYYGHRRNQRTQSTELFLEYVDDWNLKYHDLAHWYDAARDLAAFHAHFAHRSERIGQCDFLLRLDERYLLGWARRAVDVVVSSYPELGGRLARVLDDDGPAASLLASQSPTLVHNDLAPKNVIADRTTSPARTVFVDWEMAGVGCGLLDLVHLKYGLKPESDARMVATYRAAAAGTGLLPDDDAVFHRLLAACELHKTMYRLAHSGTWQLPVERVAEWVLDAEEWLARACGRMTERP